MTGTGTQTDPYIVMNADELIEATSVAEGGDARYVKLGADINMDGHVNVDMHFYELDGDGHSITNIVTQNAVGLLIHVYSTAIIKNVDFTSCSFQRTTSPQGTAPFRFIPNAICTITFRGCSYSMKFTSVNSAYKAELFNLYSLSSNKNIRVKVQRCVLDLTCISENALVPVAKVVTHGYIEFEWSHIKINSTFERYASNENLVDATSFDHCYFTGKVTPPTQPTGTTSGSSVFKGDFNNCYAAIESTGIAIPVMSGSTTGAVFYDGDIYSKESESKFKRLTTAQCKDIDYLNSIGFDVVPGE